MPEITITKSNFEDEVLKATVPVMLDFWAQWCGPCRMLAPAVAEIAEKYAGKVKVGKVNVDEEPELAAAFRVESIPMIVVMKDGKAVSTYVGYRSAEQLEEMLK